MKGLFFFAIIATILSTISAETVDPGHGNPTILIGPNTYTVGYDLIIPLSPPSTEKYYTVGAINDPTPIIQKAIDDIKKAGGGTVYIKQGTYLLSTHVFLASNLRIRGDGMDMTILKLKNNAPVFPKSGLLRIRQGSDIIISDMTVDGNKANQDPTIDDYGRYGIFTEGTLNQWFNNVRVTNWQAYGFDPHGWKDQGILGQYLTITNCISNENEWDGFTLDQSLYIQVHNCQSIHNGRHGFNVVTGSRYVTLSGNTATDNGFYYYSGSSGCGFMAQNNLLKGTNNIVFTQNTANNNKKTAFCVNDIHDMEISGNTINKSGYCYELVDTTNTVIKTNNCKATKQVKVTGTTIAYTQESYVPTTMVYMSADNTFTVG